MKSIMDVNYLALAALALAFSALSPTAQALLPSPTPDGSYPGGNTAEGHSALFSLTTGQFNTANGWNSLYTLNIGNYNTALGAATLFSNTGNANTAVGAAALFGNTSGRFNTAVGFQALNMNTDALSNTAVGADALLNNDSSRAAAARGNTAVGAGALANNVDGAFNTAIGGGALQSNLVSNSTAVGSDALALNTNATGNTAVGFQALFSNDASRFGVANSNTAVGTEALSANVDGSGNNAFGFQALFNHRLGSSNNAYGRGALRTDVSGDSNNAFGDFALLSNMSGTHNTAIGDLAGLNVQLSGNVCIGAGVTGNASDSNTVRIADNLTSFRLYSQCFIGGIYNQPWGPGDLAVRIGSDGKLGTVVSSRRFKHDIKPMDKVSEALYELKPVSFRYNKDYDATQRLASGLIAEEVADVSPDLVIRDKEGKPLSVRYEDVNTMLLNEFLKEHRAFLEEQRKVERLEQQVAALTTGLEKLSAQLEWNNSASQTVAKNR